MIKIGKAPVKEATVLSVVVPNKNLAPALVGLGFGILVYAILTN